MEVVPLTRDDQARADAEGQAGAFSHQPPIDSDHDARVYAMRAVHLRRGQPLFRARLLDAYGGRCAISGCTAAEVLEAAHVLTYRGAHTHRLDNGLLLRADLHTLFDCQLLWITPENTVVLAPALLATDYFQLPPPSSPPSQALDPLRKSAPLLPDQARLASHSLHAL